MKYEYELSTRLTFGFSLIVFVTVVLIYITANIGVGRQYEEHLKTTAKENSRYYCYRAVTAIQF